MTACSKRGRQSFRSGGNQKGKTHVERPTDSSSRLNDPLGPLPLLRIELQQRLNLRRLSESKPRSGATNELLEDPPVPTFYRDSAGRSERHQRTDAVDLGDGAAVVDLRCGGDEFVREERGNGAGGEVLVGIGRSGFLKVGGGGEIVYRVEGAGGNEGGGVEVEERIDGSFDEGAHGEGRATVAGRGVNTSVCWSALVKDEERQTHRQRSFAFPHQSQTNLPVSSNTHCSPSQIAVSPSSPP